MNTVTYTEQLYRAIHQSLDEHMSKIEEELRFNKEAGLGWKKPIIDIRIAFTKSRRDGMFVDWRATTKFSPVHVSGKLMLEDVSQGLMNLESTKPIP